MRKIFIAGSFLVNIFLVSYFCHHIFFAVPVISTGEKLVQKKQTSSSYRIAILTPASHSALQKIQQGFEDTLLKKHNLSCDFTVYNANGNRTLMRSQIEEIIQKNYDLLFTIGAHATQMAKEITTKKQHFAPIVFGAIADPVRLNIVASEEASGTHVTGDKTATNYPDQLSLLLKLKPDMKKMLLVYDPTQSSGLERDKLEIEKLCVAHNITIKAIEVYKTSEIIQKVTTFLPEVDVVMIFKDNTVVPGIDSLVKLCNRHGVTLFSSDLDSVAQGAALGFGVYEYDFGVSGAEQAYRILEEHKNPAQMPITTTKNYKLKLNTKNMQEQGLHINQELLLLIKSIEII